MKKSLLFTTALTFLCANNVVAAPALSGVHDYTGTLTEHIDAAPNDVTNVKNANASGISYTGNGSWLNNAGVAHVDNSIFENNSATHGGAIFSSPISSANVILNGSTFKGNTALKGAGGAVYNAGKLALNNSTFEGNQAKFGGALNNSATGEISSISNTKFIGNETVANQWGSRSYGGAIANKGKIGAIQNAVFENNTAGNGAAINNGTNGIIESIENSKFIGNKALTGAKQGGAIVNAGVVKTIKNTLFENNYAEKAGGAIANVAPQGSTDTQIVLENVTFKNNSAEEGAGAIYNHQKISLKGNNVFEGNNVNGKLNDINNDGNIAVEGTLSLDGGITGNASNKGTITFAQGSNLIVKAGTVISNNDVTNQGAKLNIVFDKNFNGQYKMIGEGSSLDNEFALSQDNALYQIEKGNTNGVYSVRKKNAQEIAAATGVSTTQAQTINALTAGGETSNALFNSISSNINEQLQAGNTAVFATAADIAATMAPEVAPMIQQVETENANQVFDAVSGRLSGNVASSVKGAAASEEKGLWHKTVAWVKTFFNTSDVENQSDVHGFDTESKGVALGFEQQINTQSKAGFGYAYSNTDVDAFLRDTEVDTHNAFLYGEYKPSAWYVNGIVNYAWSEYSEDKHVLDKVVGADYDVNTLGLQVMTGYDYSFGRTVVTPELGLRYLHIAQESYSDKLGSRIHENNSDIVTSVLGAKVAQDFALDNGMTLRPEARVAMTYDIENGSDGAMIALANGSAYEVNGESLDRLGVEFGLGLTAAVNDNVEVTLGYEGRYRDDYENHTGMLNAKYKF